MRRASKLASARLRERGIYPALGAGLYSIGIPKDRIMQYETPLKSDKFLVIAHGTGDEVAKAKSILETTGAAQIAAHPGVLAT